MKDYISNSLVLLIKLSVFTRVIDTDLQSLCFHSFKCSTPLSKTIIYYQNNLKNCIKPKVKLK